MEILELVEAIYETGSYDPILHDRIEKTIEKYQWVKEMENLIKTQDYRATAYRIFYVYKKERIPTTEDYSDDFHYYDSADNTTYDTIEEAYEAWDKPKPESVDEDQMAIDLPEVSKVYYVEVERFLQPFLTEKAANAFMERQKHNYSGMYTYVDSLYRNPEMRAVKELITGEDK